MDEDLNIDMQFKLLFEEIKAKIEQSSKLIELLDVNLRRTKIVFSY